MKNILAENMLRFGPKNLNESSRSKLEQLAEQQSAGSNVGITNITISQGFKDAGPVARTLVEQGTQYIWLSKLTKGGPADERPQYTAFVPSQVIVLKTTKGVMVLGKKAGKLTKRGNQWSASGDGNLSLRNVLYNPGDPNSGVGPAIQEADGTPQIKDIKSNVDPSWIGTQIMKSLAGTTDLSLYKEDRLEELAENAANVAAIAQKAGILGGPVNNQTMITYAKRR
jgi:hypothetical protein